MTYNLIWTINKNHKISSSQNTIIFKHMFNKQLILNIKYIFGINIRSYIISSTFHLHIKSYTSLSKRDSTIYQITSSLVSVMKWIILKEKWLYVINLEYSYNLRKWWKEQLIVYSSIWLLEIKNCFWVVIAI